MQAVSFSSLFQFGDESPSPVYPFRCRCIAATFPPTWFETLLQLGRPTVEFVLGRRTSVPRQVRDGNIVLYFPERWMATREKRELMQALCKLHEEFPLKMVGVITGEPVIISDFISDHMRTWTEEA